VKRLVNILGGVLTAALLSAGIASAATLVFTTGKLGTGRATVTGCTSSPLQATRSVDDNGNVTKVTVLNVPQTCSGETLAVTLERPSGNKLTSVSTTVGACIGGCSISFTSFSTTVSAANIAAYGFSLTQ
jgi:hypothetical protein